MLPLIISLFICLINNCSTLSNINIEPHRVVLNSTGQTILICTKEQNDHRGFQMKLSPNVSSKYIQTSIHRLNETSIEIILRSFGYIGRLDLFCSSEGEENPITYSEIIIARPPRILYRAERCIVHYMKYIECKIRAPMIVRAIYRRLNYTTHFVERRLPSQSAVYQSDPQLVKVDRKNKAITFRWFPRSIGYFPDDLTMIVYATISNFGTTNHTMDMTPIFRISSKFTVEIVSSTDLRIEILQNKSSSILLCQGNLSRHGRINHSNERENLRTFDQSNRTIIRVGHLHPNTWYQICLTCRDPELVRTISDIECQRYKTLSTMEAFLQKFQAFRKTYHFYSPISATVLFVICLFIFVLIVLLIIIVRYYRHKIQRQRSTIHDENMEMTTFVENPNPTTSQ